MVAFKKAAERHEGKRAEVQSACFTVSSHVSKSQAGGNNAPEWGRWSGPDTLILGYPAIDLALIDNRPLLLRSEVPISHRDMLHGYVLALTPTFPWHTAEDAVVPS